MHQGSHNDEQNQPGRARSEERPLIMELAQLIIDLAKVIDDIDKLVKKIRKE